MQKYGASPAIAQFFNAKFKKKLCNTGDIFIKSLCSLEKDQEIAIIYLLIIIYSVTDPG